MSNIEFIPANELPTTEASEVDVLCVENGELKRKAGASLGGGKLVVIKQEDLYINDIGSSNYLILVNEEICAELEKQLNGESVLNALFICEQDGKKYSDILCEVFTYLEGTISVLEMSFWNWNIAVFKTTEEADAYFALMTEE